MPLAPGRPGLYFPEPPFSFECREGGNGRVEFSPELPRAIREALARVRYGPRGEALRPARRAGAAERGDERALSVTGARRRPGEGDLPVPV
jgi:hypothetical protein